jgi:ATP/ADP translocase
MLPIVMLPKGFRRAANVCSEKLVTGNSRAARESLPRANRDESGYLWTIASVVAVAVIVTTVVEFQWKSTVAFEFRRNENELARYFGYFYGSVYLLTGTLQLFVTGTLLERRGVLAGLLLFPGVLLVACLGTFLASAERLALWGVTLMKGCDSLKRSMNDPSIQVSYGPLEPAQRHRAITFVAGITKPLAEAAAALALLAATPGVSVRGLTVPVVLLVGVWIGLNFRVWRAFVRLSNSRSADSG